MVGKVYYGRTAASDATAFLDRLDATVIADLTADPGNRGILTLYRVGSEHADFILVALWASADEAQRLDHPILREADGLAAADEGDGGGPYRVLVRGDLALGAALGLG
ncbi:MAG TPA: hypothetical protein VE596_10440 [Gaiellaceae bacterium]|jgi:hypothetical protein|nr:hypothetical protein [Gaiellaceae bacterium]